MGTLLHIEASPRGNRSYSRRVAEGFLVGYRSKAPADSIVELNVFEAELPSFDGFALQAKYNILHGEDHSPEERQAWRAVEAVIEQFTSADSYLISLPMWNFGVPYRLKHYIDILVQPGYTFEFDPQTGYRGLVVGKPICMIYARGGEYPAGSDLAAFDFQKRYMECLLGFIGFTDIRSIVVEPTLARGQQTAQARLDAAQAEALRMGEAFSAVGNPGKVSD